MSVTLHYCKVKVSLTAELDLVTASDNEESDRIAITIHEVQSYIKAIFTSGASTEIWVSTIHSPSYSLANLPTKATNAVTNSRDKVTITNWLSFVKKHTRKSLEIK